MRGCRSEALRRGPGGGAVPDPGRPEASRPGPARAGVEPSRASGPATRRTLRRRRGCSGSRGGEVRAPGRRRADQARPAGRAAVVSAGRAAVVSFRKDEANPNKTTWRGRVGEGERCAPKPPSAVHEGTRPPARVSFSPSGECCFHSRSGSRLGVRGMMVRAPGLGNRAERSRAESPRSIGHGSFLCASLSFEPRSVGMAPLASSCFSALQYVRAALARE
jgi:hypothetical protein